MKRFTSLMIVVLAAMIAAATAQQQPAQPAPPAAPAPAAPAPGAAAPHALQSMVRFVHAAPNVQIQRLALVDAGGQLAAEEIVELEYLEVTDYMAVFEGNHEIIIDVAGPEGELTQLILDDTVGTIGGQFQTVVIIGLLGPTATQAQDEGFLAWLEGLFTPDRDDLSLRTLVLDDLGTVGIEPTESDVRLVHAAPGTDEVELVLVRDGAVIDVLESANYSDVTSHSVVRPQEGTLAVRVAGTDLTIVDLGHIELTAGRIYTVLLAGTPVEEVPVEALVLADEWRDPAMWGPGMQPGVAWTPGAWPAAETAWVNERLFEVEAWLFDAQQRLEPLSAEYEQAAEALRDIAEARARIEEIRFQFEGAPVDPAAQPAQPAEPAAPEQETEEETEEQTGD
jgi:hypothetical protein